MSNKKQTAVEWLEKQLQKEEYIEKIGCVTYIINKAKEMEKQQIIDACIETTQDCFISMMSYVGQEIVFTEEDLINQRKEANEYYNKTFKQL
jgi:hypothetical protein